PLVVSLGTDPATIPTSWFFSSCYRDLRDLHSFPTRRSSDLLNVQARRLSYRQAHVLSRGLAESWRTHADLVSAWRQIEKLICAIDRKSTRLNSSHVKRSYAVFCLKKKKDRQFLPAGDALQPP